MVGNCSPRFVREPDLQTSSRSIRSSREAPDEAAQSEPIDAPGHCRRSAWRRGLTLVTSNAQAEVDGFEIESAFAVSNAITIGGSYTSLDAAKGVKIAAYGKNLGDEEYQSDIIKNAGIGFSVFGPPRSFGIAVSRSV